MVIEIALSKMENCFEEAGWFVEGKVDILTPIQDTEELSSIIKENCTILRSIDGKTYLVLNTNLDAIKANPDELNELAFADLQVVDG